MTANFKVSEIAEIINGCAFEAELFNDRSVGLPVVRIRDVVRGFSRTFYSGEYDQIYEVASGDLLIGMDGEFNIAEWRGGRHKSTACSVTSAEAAAQPTAGRQEATQAAPGSTTAARLYPRTSSL